MRDESGLLDTPDGVRYARKVTSSDGRFSAVSAEHSAWLLSPDGDWLTIPGTKRPKGLAVSSSGIVIVADWQSPSALNCLIMIFGQQGMLFSRRHRRNAGSVAISENGELAVYGTMAPKPALHVVDVVAGSVIRTVQGSPHFSAVEVTPSGEVVVIDGESRRSLGARDVDACAK